MQRVLELLGKHSYQFVILLLIITAIALLAAYGLSKRIVKPIEKMGDDLKHIDENCPYDELEPFAEKIKLQLEKKERLEKITKQFTANLSHELKTPLTAISGYGEILENTDVSAEDASRFGGIIYKESQRLISLTHDIIQLSQLEEYDFKPIIDTVDLMAVAASCTEALSVEAQKRNINIMLTMAKCLFRLIMMKAKQYSLSVTQESEFPKRVKAEFLNAFSEWINPVLSRQAEQGWGLLL